MRQHDRALVLVEGLALFGNYASGEVNSPARIAALKLYTDWASVNPGYHDAVTVLWSQVFKLAKMEMA